MLREQKPGPDAPEHSWRQEEAVKLKRARSDWWPFEKRELGPTTRHTKGARTQISALRDRDAVAVREPRQKPQEKPALGLWLPPADLEKWTSRLSCLPWYLVRAAPEK